MDAPNQRGAVPDARQMIDSTVIPAPIGQRAQKGGAETTDPTDPADLRARCTGRSRGGLTTKIHAVTDARGLPITLKLTAGQAHDRRSAEAMPGSVGPGQTLLADAGCDSNRRRDHRAGIGATAHIRPIPLDPGPSPPDRAAWRRRTRIERFFSKLKHHGAIATRYEKHDTNLPARVKRAASRIRLRVSGSVA